MDISRRVIARFCRYRSALLRFRQYGMKAVFSEELAQPLGLTSAQVRKDFSIFKIPGKKKAGYRINDLMKQFDRILDKTRVQRAVVLGAGPLGTALAREQFLSAGNIAVAAVFGEEKQTAPLPSQIEGVPVLPLSRLTAFVRAERIRYCILAVTDGSAQRYLDEAVVSGIRGILNLSSQELKTPRFCTVNSVNLLAEFDNMIFFAQHGETCKSALPSA